MTRLTLQVQLVLRALSAEPDSELYGLEIVEATGLLPGTVYPILARLEHAGWLSSRWEVIDQRVEGRPRRRYYRLTADGAVAATVARDRAEARARSRKPGLTGRPLLGGAQ
jgi:PadR family transcriptional regulator PadR